MRELGSKQIYLEFKAVLRREFNNVMVKFEVHVHIT